ncbi:hypothetical protein Drose_06955 [Dactylosporangium roseum]|uniref:Uncharacterized protein n=1 Tax=Dactylosporangium roseum TaxID=47989 RepID=A0ABY5Z7G5_9ACTN|nr:hypothetical protein [Dactylosporangium roseum]UWZ38003.1 hypothetical protein Drose_06955 [Dactylosporangium roseum]
MTTDSQSGSGSTFDPAAFRQRAIEQATLSCSRDADAFDRDAQRLDATGNHDRATTQRHTAAAIREVAAGWSDAPSAAVDLQAAERFAATAARLAPADSHTDTDTDDNTDDDADTF